MRQVSVNQRKTSAEPLHVRKAPVPSSTHHTGHGQNPPCTVHRATDTHVPRSRSLPPTTSPRGSLQHLPWAPRPRWPHRHWAAGWMLTRPAPAPAFVSLGGDASRPLGERGWSEGSKAGGTPTHAKRKEPGVHGPGTCAGCGGHSEAMKVLL